MAYQAYNVLMRKEDQAKADAILEKHWMAGDIDVITTNVRENSDGSAKVEYWISPYICEDLDVIVDEFKLVGIHIV
jgi:hypothetical protein